VYEWIVDSFINTKIMLPDSRLFMKNHGIPSGSLFTSIIGTIINIRRTVFLLLKQHINIENLRALGDDMTFELDE
jgi:hypothetical protein